MAKNPTLKKCPGCGKTFQANGFMNHIKAKHPDRLHLYVKPELKLQAELVTDLLDNLVEAVKSETKAEFYLKREIERRKAGG